MIIVKIISTALDIQNCINIYTDPENIHQILVDRFEGRCISGCYVLKVGEIVRTGECVINQDGLPTFGNIPVTFKVTAIVYAAGEIINGCIVKNRDKKTGILICSSDISSIMVSAHPSMESITNGQIISVRVVASKYNISSTKVAISAVPYMFSAETVVYRAGPVTEAILGNLSNVLERIKYEEEQMEQLKIENPKAWDIFDKLLYAYNTPQQPPAGAKLVNIKSLLTLGSNAVSISRDSRINLSTPNVYVYDNTVTNVKTSLATSSVYVVLLEDYCAHLRTIREMVGIYNTEEIVKNHRNLWQIFKKNKI